jgi:hypothetical protein
MVKRQTNTQFKNLKTINFTGFQTISYSRSFLLKNFYLKLYFPLSIKSYEEAKNKIVALGDPSAGHRLGGERGQAPPVKQGKTESHLQPFFFSVFRHNLAFILQSAFFAAP